MYSKFFFHYLYREVRNYPIDKQSVTHKNFNGKTIPPIKRANKQEIEKEIVDILEHSSGSDLDNKKISIAHSSYIAPEITIGKSIYILKFKILQNNNIKYK